MKTKRLSHIVLTVCAAFAAAVLFVTYGTVLPAAPFAALPLNGPTFAESNGELAVVVDGESHRALILNADGDLTGVVACSTIDSPVDAITDACVSDGLVYLSGASFAPDSDVIERERIATYDKGGNFQGIIVELPGANATIPSIKSISAVSGGIAMAYEKPAEWDSGKGSGEAPGDDTATDVLAEGATIAFDLVSADGAREPRAVAASHAAIHDVAYRADDAGNYVILDSLGELGDSASEGGPKVHPGHVFTAIDIDDEGVVYACDDETGALCTVGPGASSVHVLVPGDGYDNVSENSGVVSLCDVEADQVMMCDASGAVSSEFEEVRPSVGFSARMLLVWASGLYLAVLALLLAVRKLHQLVKEGRTESVGPVLLAVAVVSAVAVAIGSLSLSSYRSSLELRANEINMCADYLESVAPELSGAMKGVGDRDALRKDGEDLMAVVANLLEALAPAHILVSAANDNDIGMYYNLYGKDERGTFYLCGSADEYVMGTSARLMGGGELERAFEGKATKNQELLSGRTLRDTAQYRLVQIPSADNQETVGVIEIGSKMRSFESSITGSLAQRILALLVMVLVIYLAYSELRACGQCLFDYRRRKQQNATDAMALLTRPFTLAITLLTSIDSVMTVLIARDLLTKAGAGAESPLLALPAVMLGVGLVVGQSLYGYAGSQVGLRRLAARGAFAMLLCACLTGVAVAFGGFWAYCAAKFAMSLPFGMLYAMGYSLPRLAQSEEVRMTAAGGVRRTDTSAAALGTVLGGYAAQALGNEWVYVLVAIACLIVIVMALNLLPRDAAPLEQIAQPEHLEGRIGTFVKTPTALAIAFLVVLPATVASGYASFLFPLFSSDLGLSKSDINNIVVLGQLIVYVCISRIENLEGRHGRWRMVLAAAAALGVVFLLFSVNTTLVWSFAVVAIVALLHKVAEGWKALWIHASGYAGVPAGPATSAMFSTRSLALVAQPFILGGLLAAADSVAVIIIGLFCVVCATLFYFITRHTPLAGS